MLAERYLDTAVRVYSFEKKLAGEELRARGKLTKVRIVLFLINLDC